MSTTTVHPVIQFPTAFQETLAGTTDDILQWHLVGFSKPLDIQAGVGGQGRTPGDGPLILGARGYRRQGPPRLSAHWTLTWTQPCVRADLILPFCPLRNPHARGALISTVTNEVSELSNWPKSVQ